MVANQCRAFIVKGGDILLGTDPSPLPQDDNRIKTEQNYYLFVQFLNGESYVLKLSCPTLSSTHDAIYSSIRLYLVDLVEPCLLLAGRSAGWPDFLLSRSPHLHLPSPVFPGSRKKRIVLSCTTPSCVLASPGGALCAAASISLLGSGPWHADSLFHWILSASTLSFLAAMEPNLAIDPSGNCEDIQRSSQSWRDSARQACLGVSRRSVILGSSNRKVLKDLTRRFTKLPLPQASRCHFNRGIIRYGGYSVGWQRTRTSSVRSIPTGHQVMQRPHPTHPDMPNWSIQEASLCVSHMR